MTEGFDTLGKPPKRHEVGGRLLYEKGRCHEDHAAPRREGLNEGPHPSATVSLTVPRDVVEAIAEKAAELVHAARTAGASPWLTRAEAADYLRVPISRLEKKRTVPHHHWEGRVFYHRDELDAFVRSSDNKHP